jgi:acetyl-CoA carboxylase carboxyl transferase subunit beta
LDNNEYEILKTPSPPDDPLNFVDTKKYIDRLATARKLTKQDDAIMIASGKLKGINVTVGAQNFSFIGGSVGAASGEAFICGVQHAIDNQTPFIFFCCSGGIRMMESAIALQQMSRVVIAVNELKKNNLPYIVILTNPSYGGVTASFGMLGDIQIAEPKSQIGFAGKRVIEQTIGETLPEGFQTAEYIKDHGGIDLVISRKDLRDTIGTLITILLKKNKVTLAEATNENQEDPQKISWAAS